MAAAIGYQAGLRLVRRHLQCQRAANPRPQSERRQSADPADRQRHRGRPLNPTVGAVVSDRSSSRRIGWTSRSASRASTRNSWSARTPATSSTPCSAGRWCRRRTCPAAGRPIRFRRWACGSRARPIDPVTFLVGVFNGSPVATTASTRRSADAEPSGTSFPLNGGVLVIAEMQYSYPSLGTMLYADQAEPLARTYKLGFWYDTESFADQQFDNDRPVARQPREQRRSPGHHGDFSIYAVADQLVWVDPEEARPDDQPVRPGDGRAAGRSQPDHVQPECRPDVPRAVPAPRRRHVRHRHGLRQGQRQRRRAGQGHRFLHRHLRPGRAAARPIWS